MGLVWTWADTSFDNTEVFQLTSACRESTKAFFTPWTTSTEGGLGVHKPLKEYIAETPDPNWPMGYPKHMVPWLHTAVGSIYSCGEKKEGKDAQGNGICIHKKTATHDRALLSWRRLNNSLPMKSSELIPCFASLGFALPIFYLFLRQYLPSSQPMSFLTFIPPILPPTPLVEKWLRDCVILHCHLELNYNTFNTRTPTSETDTALNKNHVIMNMHPLHIITFL